MTIYVAICDDNIADRKQTERLLNREKDSRLNTNGDVIYIESFGSSDALYKTPVKYDLFIIDVTSQNAHGMDIAKTLRSRGILAPIVLLSSQIDYKSFSNEPERIIHIEKPINKGQISHVIDTAFDWNSKKPKLIEIRGKNDTLFLKHQDIVRFAQKSNYVEVSISNGTYIEVPDTLKRFSHEISGYNCFIPCKNAIISIHHIVGLDGHAVTLSNNERYELNMCKIRKILISFIKYTIEKNLGNDK